MSDIPARLRALAAFWNTLEGRAKQAEQFRHETITAAINEMRYAGRRIVDALDMMNGEAPDTAEIEKQLVIAETYLINADHDITDSICFTVHKRVARTITRYGVDKVAQLLPGFGPVYPQIAEINKIIQTSRKDRINRVSDYLRIRDQYLPIIMPLYEQLVQNPDLAVPDSETEQFQILRKRVSFVKWLGIIASVASILGVIVSIFAWIYAWSEFMNDVIGVKKTAPAARTQQSK